MRPEYSLSSSVSSFFSPSLFLVLSHFPLISSSSLSITISSGADMFLRFWWLVYPRPTSIPPPNPPRLTEKQDYLLIYGAVLAHTIKSFQPVCLTNIFENRCLFCSDCSIIYIVQDVCSMCNNFVFAQNTLLHCVTPYLDRDCPLMFLLLLHSYRLILFHPFHDLINYINISEAQIKQG